MLTLIQNPVLMRSIVSDSVVCQSVCHTSEPCKKLLYHLQSSMSCIQQVYQSSLLFSQNVRWCSMLPPGESRLVCATYPIIKVGTKDWTDKFKFRQRQVLNSGICGCGRFIIGVQIARTVSSPWNANATLLSLSLFHWGRRSFRVLIMSSPDCCPYSDLKVL